MLVDKDFKPGIWLAGSRDKHFLTCAASQYDAMFQNPC